MIWAIPANKISNDATRRDHLRMQLKNAKIQFSEHFCPSKGIFPSSIQNSLFNNFSQSAPIFTINIELNRQSTNIVDSARREHKKYIALLQIRASSLHRSELALKYVYDNILTVRPIFTMKKQSIYSAGWVGLYVYSDHFESLWSSLKWSESSILFPETAPIMIFQPLDGRPIFTISASIFPR